VWAVVPQARVPHTATWSSRLRACCTQAFITMRTSAAVVLCIVALVASAGCDAKPMPAARAPACTAATEPGTVCRGTVNGKPQTCVQPITPTSAQCPTGLLQVCVSVLTSIDLFHSHAYLPTCLPTCQASRTVDPADGTVTPNRYSLKPVPQLWVRIDGACLPFDALHALKHALPSCMRDCHSDRRTARKSCG
jgi:hypothetical protein